MPLVDHKNPYSGPLINLAEIPKTVTPYYGDSLFSQPGKGRHTKLVLPWHIE
jgi:hypothetical protein